MMYSSTAPCVRGYGGGKIAASVVFDRTAKNSPITWDPYLVHMYTSTHGHVYTCTGLTRHPPLAISNNLSHQICQRCRFNRFVREFIRPHLKSFEYIKAMEQRYMGATGVYVPLLSSYA